MTSAKTLRAKKRNYYSQNIDIIKNKRKEYYKQTGKAKADLDYQKNQKQKKNSLSCLLEG